MTLVQVSPVDENAASQGTANGAYQRNQAVSGGIIGFMNVIKSDFERTIKQTTEEERREFLSEAIRLLTRHEEDTKGEDEENGKGGSNQSSVSRILSKKSTEEDHDKDSQSSWIYDETIGESSEPDTSIMESEKKFREN